jgi:hypothetical protein
MCNAWRFTPPPLYAFIAWDFVPLKCLVSPVIIGDSLVGSPPSIELKNMSTYFGVVLQFIVYDYENDT